MQRAWEAGLSLIRLLCALLPLELQTAAAADCPHDQREVFAAVFVLQERIENRRRLRWKAQFFRPSQPLSLEPRMAFLLFCFGQPHTLVWLHLSSNTHEVSHQARR
jgi:hypothetical protein